MADPQPLLPPSSLTPLGPDLFAAPSNIAPNNVAAMSKSFADLVALAKRMNTACDILQSALDDNLANASEAFSGARDGINAIAGIAKSMEETAPFATFGNQPPTPSPLTTALRQKADALVDAWTAKTGGSSNVDVRKFVKALDDSIRGNVSDLFNMLRDDANFAVIQSFVGDKSVDPSQRYLNMWFFGGIVSRALTLLARTERGDDVRLIGTEVYEHQDTKLSVPAVAIAGSSTLWPGFVAAAQLGTSLVGNLPAPDSLSMALLKVYAARRMPDAAVAKLAANSLESDVFSMLKTALKLTSDQQKELGDRVDALKQAQADLIHKAQAEAAAAGPGPTNARQAFDRMQAQENLAKEAEKVSRFYEDTYGPENQKLFGSLQRGPFMDGFVTVLTLVQLCAAWQEMNDPDISTLQKIADAGASGVMAFGAVVSTVGKRLGTIDIGVARLNIAFAGKFFDAIGARFATFAGVMAIVSGGAQVVSGLFDSDKVDPVRVVVGGANIGFGAALLWGTLASSVTGNVVAASIGALLSLYFVGVALVDASKSEPQRAIEQILDGLEKRRVFNSKTAIQHLGLDAPLKELRDAVVTGACAKLARNPKGDPTREALIARMQALGFDAASATTLVENANDELARAIPQVVPPAM